MSHLAILDEDTGAVKRRIEDLAIYIHQLAVDGHGDLYTASVYPEHAVRFEGQKDPHTVAGLELKLTKQEHHDDYCCSRLRL